MKKLILSSAVVVGLAASASLAQTPPPKPAPPAAVTPPAKAPETKPAPPPATTPPATTPPAAAPAMPPPAPELAAWLKDLTKTLNCKSSVKAGPMGPGYTTTSKATVKKELNGYFYSTKYEEAKAKGMTMPPYTSMGVIGFDPTKKTLERADYDGMGGIVHWSSSGWDGDKLVFTGKVLQSNGDIRESYVKDGKGFKHTVEFKGPDGNWTAMVENVCK